MQIVTNNGIFLEEGLIKPATVKPAKLSLMPKYVVMKLGVKWGIDRTLKMGREKITELENW